MTDKFIPTNLDKLLSIIISQYRKNKSIFGIPEELFFKPKAKDPFRFNRFGHLLENPIGVAAGPHTQLSQNIVAAWLCGARYIELKTIQTLDELEISKPCIDMQEEGYNCEWSQELKIKESFEQYLDAWIIIHVLRHFFGWKANTESGVIFNMSVGYNLDGILKDNVQWFFSKMKDASVEIKQKVDNLKQIFPEIVKLNINPCISDNITLSTMHGCPPEEIEKIGVYLLKEKKLHTTIKLNPTLLGKNQLHEILKNSGFETQVPDIAFEHDLKYPDAVKIIGNLEKLAIEEKLHFGLKLTNTLESINNKEIFPAQEKMMYMSGKALHPISICVAKKLQNDFNGKLDISFSAGVDAFNISDVVNCGLYPVTVCSDILKPGGYGRLHQYISQLKESFSKKGAKSISEYIQNDNYKDEKLAALNNLKDYAFQVKHVSNYKRKGINPPSIKTSKKLSKFDCIHAPCETTCPTSQGVPDYMHYAANNNFEKANEVILKTNPFPLTTGMVCDHTCQTKCTRINYDSSLLIRDVKRAIAENAKEKFVGKIKEKKKKVAIVGAGPAGLACAFFLAKAGFSVEIHESKTNPGGMVLSAIPQFRLTAKALETDIQEIQKLGINIHYNSRIDSKKFELLRKSSDYIFIAIGAQRARSFLIPGSETNKVLNPLEFLYHAKSGKHLNIGKKVIVIGGGNTAMDAARTAKRLVGTNGEVRILYRRTIKQMPANYEEIKAVWDEGIRVEELVNPVSFLKNSENNTILVCQKMKLGDKDASGRPKPVKIEGSEFEIECDTVIPAVGQELAIDFIEEKKLETIENGYETQIPNIFIGGDALNGGLSVVAAIGDGRKVTQLIIDKEKIDYNTVDKIIRERASFKELMIKKAKRVKPVVVEELAFDRRDGFELISTTLTKEKTIEEASRCLLCDELCNICTTVCPNLALFGYKAKVFKTQLQNSDQVFEINQSPQILHIADWCNQCGNCNIFCPTDGAPFKMKAHLYLSEEAFNFEDEGFFYEFSSSDTQLLYKWEGSTYILEEKVDCFSFEQGDLKLQLEKESFNLISSFKETEEIKDAWLNAVEMCVVLDGVKQFFGLNV